MLISASYLTVKNWVPQFKTGYFSTEDEDHPGRALLVTVLENVDAVHSMILTDQRILAREIAETLGGYLGNVLGSSSMKC
jgi:hypothetical protein